ncbi:MAG TPA: glutaredoxin family protein [Virgibacillus sp.]|nr:glutaredoxin family protein [Virgibacillus sp.]
MDKKVTIYISNNSTECRRLKNQLDEWKIDYQTKNISDDRKNLERLQGFGIFATPAVFVDDTVILGFQKNKLKKTLGIDYQSYYRTIL